MVTVNYLMMLGVGTVLMLVLALVNHAAHAYLAMPDSWRTDVPGRMPEHTDGEYDSDGFWEFASLRNYMIHAGGGLLLVWGPGLWYWSSKEQALAAVCGYIGKVGLTPMFCM